MFQLQAEISNIRTLANHSLKITLDTQDISKFTPEELAELFRLNEKTIWAVFKEQEIKAEDLDIKEIKLDGQDKTPSRRLRACLYRLWEQSGSKEDYPKQMEKFIDAVKMKLS